MSGQTVKFMLGEQDIPTHWVNLMADLPGGAPPPLHPGTKQPAGPDDLTPLFPMALILQEVSAEPQIEIPEPVRDAYKLWRPLLSFARDDWSATSTPRLTSITSTRVVPRPARISPTPPSPGV